MAKNRVLFGKKIVPHHMLNYAEQIYDILVAEIELGRWGVNERLPGVIHLARELEFGTKTIQTAYDRLKQDGYIHTLGYRGTYLTSQHPLQTAASGGKIGVLVSEEQTGQPLILWYEHVILQFARRRNLVTEVRTLPNDIAASEVNRRGVVFGEDVIGIISLTPFRMPVRFGDAGKTLPVAFLCPPYEPCVPKVCADVREAYYDLTARLIRSGHRNIIFSEDSIEPDPRQTIMHREGYLEAMCDHGLPVDQGLLNASRRVDNARLPTVTEHLKAIMKKNRAGRPTAVVAGSLGRSTVLSRIAPLHHIAIPADLSIVSIGSAHINGDSGPQLTGMLPDFDLMVEHCLSMLQQQRTSGKCDHTAIQVRMHFVPGDTMRSLVAIPDEEGEVASRTDRELIVLSAVVS
jgi:DNA-binding LacI/PurR family transcriptional regulator